MRWWVSHSTGASWRAQSGGRGRLCVRSSARQNGLTLMICPRLSNPENLGAIARIGDVFGINAILAGPACPDPLSRRVMRVSMGSSLRIPIIVSDRLGEIVDKLVHDDNLELRAAVADPAAEPFDAVPRPDRLGLVLGEEDQGIEAEWLDRCRSKITIPMREGAGSLNVAVAAGILIHSVHAGSAKAITEATSLQGTDRRVRSEAGRDRERPWPSRDFGRSR